MEVAISSLQVYICHFFLLTLFHFSTVGSHSWETVLHELQHGPSHRLQFFTNCLRMGPFQGVQSFRSKLLQCGFPTWSQVLTARLLQGGLLSPWDHRPCQKPAPAQMSLSPLKLSLSDMGAASGIFSCKPPL